MVEFVVGAAGMSLLGVVLTVHGACLWLLGCGLVSVAAVAA